MTLPIASVVMANVNKAAFRPPLSEYVMAGSAPDPGGSAAGRVGLGRTAAGSGHRSSRSAIVFIPILVAPTDADIVRIRSEAVQRQIVFRRALLGKLREAFGIAVRHALNGTVHGILRRAAGPVALIADGFGDSFELSVRLLAAQHETGVTKIERAVIAVLGEGRLGVTPEAERTGAVVGRAQQVIEFR